MADEKHVHVTDTGSATTGLVAPGGQGLALPGAGFYIGPQHFERYITARWDPKPDITAYELALCLPIVVGGHLTREKWDALGAANRHIVID